ncbi:uracil-DNA glycosylase [Flavobacterium sp.]
MTDVEKFIEYLEHSVDFPNSRNLYEGSHNLSLLRKSNLKLYLEEMKISNPKTLLLGEAPGYKGCGNTGIAFTSERIILTNNFFLNKNFKVESKLSPESEISATIIWNEIVKQKHLPLLWNIYPYHPYKNNFLKSNRTPNVNELQFGKTILKRLLDIFEIENIIAVGRKAEKHVKEINVNYIYVRHPANGGKNKFVSDYEKAMKKMIKL